MRSTVVGLFIAGFVLLQDVMFPTAAFAADPTVKCQQAKLKAQGKYQACIKKSAAGVIGGKDDAAATCLSKFQAALAKADDKAAAADPPTSCRYIDNGDGTVSDINTGLAWEKKDDLGGIHDKDNTYTWASSGTTRNGTAFTDFLGTLNGGTSNDGTAVVTPCFTGHCDWRLPTIQELKGIVDLTRGNCGGGSGACIDPVFGTTQADFYWSSTAHSSLSSNAWDVDFSDGTANDDLKSPDFYLRAVRGGL